MKKLLLLLLLPFNAYALDVIGQNETCILEDGSVIKNCAVFNGANGEEPNVYMKWGFASERVDGTLFLPHDVTQTNILFKNIATGNYTSQQIVKKAHTAAFMYKPPETYATTMTVTDKFGFESAPDNEVVITVAVAPTDPPVNPPDLIPKPPTIYFPLPAGNTAVITISPKVR